MASNRDKMGHCLHNSFTMTPPDGPPSQPGVTGRKLRKGAMELVRRGPFRTHRKSRDFRFWVWPWHSAARIAFPASFGGRNAVDNCRFHPFWEIAATIPKAMRSFL